VDHLFAYEKPTSLLAFLERRFETDLKIPVKNVSPSAVDTSLPEPLEKRLRKRLAPDIELHQDVLNSGHWRRD
ncbi:MAG: hypothetical protein P8L32_04870, partial [Paracoccaceae bacterium]|nr:hypothetical protein [Paracoccaceae bacterium]